MNPVDNWFDSIYVSYHDKMVKLAFYLLGDEELSKDIAHMAFLTLLTKYESLREHPNIYGWLALTVRNLVMNERQKACHTKEVPLLSEFEPAAEDVAFDFFSALPHGLSDEERRLLYLHFEVGLSYDEISVELGCSPEACRMRLYRAKKRCRALLVE